MTPADWLRATCTLALLDPTWPPVTDAAESIDAGCLVPATLERATDAVWAALQPGAESAARLSGADRARVRNEWRKRQEVTP